MVDQPPGPGEPKEPDKDEPGLDDVKSTDWSGSPVQPPAAPPQPATPPSPATPPPPVGWAAPPPSAPPPSAGWAAEPNPPAGPAGAPPPAGTPPPAGWAAPPSAPPPSAGWAAAPAAQGTAPPVAWAAVTPPPPVEIAPGLVFGSTGRRFVAYILDSIITAIVAWILFLAIDAILSLDSATASGLLYGVTFAAVTFAYFVLTWRSSARATPGMRFLKLQVGNAFDGRTLSNEQAVRRWVAMGFPLYLLSSLGAIGAIASLASLILVIVLLITTATSPTKQGLHDRFANSAVVEPVGMGNGAIVGCIVLLVVVFLVLPLIAIIGLISVGSQVSTILSSVGSPAP